MITISITTFGNGLSQEVAQLKELTHDVFTTAVDIVEDSVVNGNPLLGSPGQPEDLRDGDWVKSYENDWVAVIQTSEKSARSVEDGISYKYGVPLTKLKSDKGGFHSVKATETNFEDVVRLAAFRNGFDAR